jgi:hypothetical protein
MQDNMPKKDSKADKLPDEDGTVLVYGFVQIRDKKTGEVLVSTRS